LRFFLLNKGQKNYLKKLFKMIVFYYKGNPIKILHRVKIGTGLQKWRTLSSAFFISRKRDYRGTKLSDKQQVG